MYNLQKTETCDDFGVGTSGKTLRNSLETFFSVETTESKNPVSLKNMFFKNCLMILLMEKTSYTTCKKGPPSYSVVYNPNKPYEKPMVVKWV